MLDFIIYAVMLTLWVHCSPNLTKSFKYEYEPLPMYSYVSQRLFQIVQIGKYINCGLLVLCFSLDSREMKFIYMLYIHINLFLQSCLLYVCIQACVY